jgi:chromosomal replication initiation ATPase DnaA
MYTAILRRCCQLFGVCEKDLLGDNRFPFLCTARFALYKALRLRGLNYAEIGRRVGGRDRSTVRHGTDRADYIMERDPEFAEAVWEMANMKEKQYDRRD